MFHIFGSTQGMRTEKPALRARSCSPRRSCGDTSNPCFPRPRRDDIRPPQIRMRIAPSTTINNSSLAWAALGRFPTFPDAAPAGAEDKSGALLIPRLSHGLQDAAAAAAEGTPTGHEVAMWALPPIPPGSAEDMGHAQPRGRGRSLRSPSRPSTSTL